MSRFGLRESDPEGVHLRKLIYSYDPDAGIGQALHRQLPRLTQNAGARSALASDDHKRYRRL